ncbi:hypothetical protein [Streptomyces mirabilis]|uniref:hypothetical protein n=1 Tax=Streptomyces mirabilis TaxID=68239 RepID=UPI00368FEF37
MLALGVVSDALGMVVGVGVGVTDGVGASVGDGTGLGVLLGDLLGVAVVLLGAGLGLSWVQATGPTRNAATKAAVIRGRRTGLLDWDVWAEGR